jgi:hypothetical protein
MPGDEQNQTAVPAWLSEIAKSSSIKIKSASLHFPGSYFGMASYNPPCQPGLPWGASPAQSTLFVRLLALKQQLSRISCGSLTGAVFFLL